MRRFQALSLQAQWAAEAEAWDDALRLFQELARELEAAGLSSAFVHWSLAVIHDTLEEFDMALNEIRKALALDPLALNFNGSFELIASRLREHLWRLPVTDESVPRLYGVLAQSGDADVPSHLVMARHLAATGRLEQAEQLLEALALTAPASRDLWVERARLARQRGDLASAALFEVEAHARALADVPFTIPPHLTE
jgi:tetratricopeptide (TPR) repeat protein